MHVGKSYLTKDGPQWGNYCFTQIHMKLTLVLRNSGASNRKQKFKCRKNCFDNMVLDLWKRLSNLSIKLLWKKVKKKKKVKTQNPKK